MTPGTPHDRSPEGRLEENDPVWRLLAQAPLPEPDAWFAVRAIARCRHEGIGDGERTHAMGWLPSIGAVWRLMLGGGLAVALAIGLVVNHIQADKAEKQKSVQEAFEFVASIDSDSDSSSSSPWQDTSR